MSVEEIAGYIVLTIIIAWLYKLFVGGEDE